MNPGQASWTVLLVPSKKSYVLASFPFNDNYLAQISSRCYCLPFQPLLAETVLDRASYLFLLCVSEAELLTSPITKNPDVKKFVIK